ncbi:MAG: 3-deoxy-manno-octulosonate cytidylyltransferase [Marinilabiliales bacterium]|nr:3-deoxy-manno-octulosonate cytidylyltransferase [Marinilabiliales bacterium]
MSPKFIALIPSRYASSRFPGKPLADIAGKSMIQRVYEQVVQAVEETWVATDDERIAAEVKRFGGKVVMTSTEHRSGTDRCAEAVKRVSEQTGQQFDVVINVQGDEPFIHPDQIRFLQQPFVTDCTTEIATLIQKIRESAVLFNPAEAKVVLDKLGNAIFFSRQPIPMVFRSPEEEWIGKFPYFCHVGMYAYRTDVLEQLNLLPEGALEKAESLEMLRWLENGYQIRTVETDHATVGIDTPEELAVIVAAGVEKYYAKY